MGACRWCGSVIGSGLLALAWGCPASAASPSQTVLSGLLAEATPLPSDSLATPRTGHESVLALTWARREPGLLPQVETAARLRLELELEGLRRGEGAAWRDGSSWLGADVEIVGGGRLGLKAFPLDTDSERLGYLHALDWGGTDTARAESIFVSQSGGVPGFELAFATGGVSLRAAMRWATVPSSGRLWAGQLRGELRLNDAWRADFGLGYFERPGGVVDASRGFVEGASVRFVWHRGEQSEPDVAPEPFRPPALADADQVLTAPEARGTSLAFEAVTLATRLRRFEVPDQTHLALTPAIALYGSSRGAGAAGHVALSWRSLGFVQRHRAGLMRGETAPATAVEHAELAAWLGASFVAGLGFSPSVQLGVLLPAALEAPSALPGFAQSFVVREAGEVVALPVGSSRLPVLAARAGLRSKLSRSLSLLVFADYERDPNRVRLVASAWGAQRAFAPPDRFGGGVALQTVF